MKTTLAILIVILTAAISRCQLVTNWVAAAPNFRDVNGQLYNSNESVLWHLIDGECTATKGGSVAVRVNTDYGSMPALHGKPTTPAEIASPYAKHDQMIVLLNYPKVAIGDNVYCTAMCVGFTNLHKGDYQLWDCGTLHRVAVVTTNAAPQHVSH